MFVKTGEKRQQLPKDLSSPRDADNPTPSKLSALPTVVFAIGFDTLEGKRTRFFPLRFLDALADSIFML